MNLLAEVYDVEVGIGANSSASIHVLLVNRPEHWDFSRLGDWLYRERRRQLSICDVVVVRQPPDRFENVGDQGADKGSDMTRRIPDKPLYLLGASKGIHVIGKNLNGSCVSPLADIDAELFLRQLRQSELANIARRTGAIFSAKPTRIFRAPSKMFAEYFFRAGNVQKSRAVLDAFYYWLLPFFSDTTAILTETWSISSIGQHAGRLLSKGRKTSDCVVVDMLNRYHDGSPSADKYIEDIVDRLTHFETGTLTVVVSAAVSYHSLNRLIETVTKGVHQGWKIRWILLFRLAEADPPSGVSVLCDLHNIPEENAYKPVKECPKDKEIVDIDPTTYFPVTAIQETYVSVTASHARGAKAFFNKYAGSGVFSLHRDNYVGGGRFRHHAIYPDVIKLLGQATFVDGFRENLLSLDVHPTYIVTPPHDAGVALVKAAVEIYRHAGRKSPGICHHISLDFSLEAESECAEFRRWLHAAQPSDAILILDDVAVTGERLNKYQRSLRGVLADQTSKPYRGQIHYLVALARPTTLVTWEIIKRRHTMRGSGLKKHTVSSVEELVLPNWTEADCPWCQELNILKEIGAKRGYWPRRIARRISELTDKAVEKTASRSVEVFLRPSFCQSSLANPLELRPGSIFKPEGMNDIEVFVSVASSLQEIRNLEGIGMRSYPSVHLLKSDEYLGKQFSESVLRASLVRAARRTEMESLHANNEELRGVHLREAIMDPPHGECIGLDLFLASSMFKLPWPKFSKEELELLKARGYGDDLIVFAQRYTR